MMFSGAMALIDVPCHQNVNKFIGERKKINWRFTYDARLPPSVGENQFSSIAGLTDALQTNPHQIKTYTVTEYRHFRQ